MSDLSIQPTSGKHTLGSFGEAMKRMPGAMWLAMADACDRSFRGFWPVFRAGMGITRTGYRFTLTNFRNWPIEITINPIPSYTAPDFSRFRARFGTHSEAAKGLEFGGEGLPTRSRWIAIPIAGARSRATGRLLPGHQTPDKARKSSYSTAGKLQRKGKAFLTQTTANPNVLLLYPWVKPRRGRGRRKKNTRKNANPNRLIPGPVPAFMLVRKISQKGGFLGLQDAWVRNMPETERRLGENIGRAVADILAGRVPKTRIKSLVG